MSRFSQQWSGQLARIFPQSVAQACGLTCASDGHRPPLQMPCSGALRAPLANESRQTAASDGHRPPLQFSDGHRPPLQLSDGHRPPLQWLCACFISLALVSTAHADTKIDGALQLAATYLVSQQKPQGMVGDTFPMPNTALAVLALAACGHQPGEATPEGLAMRKAIDYVLLPDNQTKDGYFGKVDNSRMYGHGITTLMLAEMLGMGLDDRQDALMRQKCKLGVELILRAQGMRKDAQNAGGWQYEPDSRGSDLSVTCWQTMALRASQNAGLDVPREAIDKVVAYMKRLYKPLGDKRGPNLPGGFGYSSPATTTSTTAEGLLAMQVCGQYQAEETLAAGDLLFQTDLQKDKQWFFYTTYYYAQGMYQRGGKYADAAQRAVPAMLLPLQSREGWWQSVGGEETGPGKTYCTSLAVLALAVKNHYLPIYQR